MKEEASDRTFWQTALEEATDLLWERLRDDDDDDYDDDCLRSMSGSQINPLNS